MKALLMMFEISFNTTSAHCPPQLPTLKNLVMAKITSIPQYDDDDDDFAAVDVAAELV